VVVAVGILTYGVGYILHENAAIMGVPYFNNNDFLVDTHTLVLGIVNSENMY
jgi:hypothetical protein